MLGGDDAAPVWISRARVYTYGELRARLPRLEGPRQLAFVHCDGGFESLVRYLTCLVNGWPAVLLESPDELESVYRPGYWLGPSPPSGFAPVAPGVHFRDSPCELHPDLCLLLATSGSTGSPKLVRLSSRNLVSNADAIAAYMELSASERPLLSLPLSYAYGLSVVNSHLRVGAALVDPEATFLQDPFWEAAHDCTSLAGVPFFYESLLRLKVDLAAYPRLRTLTQAGGPLAVPVQRRLLETGKRVFIMYGQTEATARMAYVPPERLPEKLGSIGIAIPGGELSLEGGEIIYRGPNVMLGYATSVADLARGDELGGRLATGDLGTCDDEGFFQVTGRVSRFAKLFGKRINLEDVESWVEASAGPAMAVEREGRLVVSLEGPAGTLRGELARRLGLPPPAVVVLEVAALPRSASGKKARA